MMSYLLDFFGVGAGVASDNLHDHARGTLIVRPSTRFAVIVYSVTLTSLILISWSLTARIVYLVNHKIMGDYRIVT